MAVFILIFLLLLFGYALLIDYYRKAWKKIPLFDAGNTNPSVRISVVIAARNEEANIKALIESLAIQNYPTELYEVIIIDDHSEDRTWHLASEYHETLSQKSIRLQDQIKEGERLGSFKKKAIEVGISVASGKLIVTTDADCRFHPDWLRTIAAHYEEMNAKFIAAPVKLTGDFSLLSIFQILDFLVLQGITGASVYKRFNSLCNGANLGYERNAFYEVKGFEGIDNIASGDDLLLMHKIFLKYPNEVFYLKSEKAIVTTETQKTWKEFFQQRIRWASKADRYQDKRIFWVLLFVYLINCCFIILAVAAFFKFTWLIFFLLFLLAKILIEFPFVNAIALFFKQENLMRYFPFLQPIHILYTIIAGTFGTFGSFEWKGRVVKRSGSREEVRKSGSPEVRK